MNYTDLLDQLNIKYIKEGHHHCRSGWAQVDCPFCGKGSEKYHMGLNLSHGFFNCWRCGFHNLVSTLSLITGLSTGKIIPLLGNLRPSITSVIPQTGKLKLPKGVGPLQPSHERYLKQRKYDPAEISELWGVQGIGLSSQLPWRLFLPITHQYETVSWTTRAIGKAEPKYISAGPLEESLPHKSLLYGEDLASHAIIIVEGPFDAWRIGPGAVATFGLNYSPEQLRRMKNYPVRVVCFDNSDLAQKRASALADRLEVFDGETHVVCLSGPDPDSTPKMEIRQLRSHFLR